MVVKPLAALTVGEEAVARSSLRGALERRLCSGNLDGHWRCGQQPGSRGMHGGRVHRPQRTRISEARLLVGVFQLLLEGDSCSRNVSRLGGEVAVHWVSWLLVRQVLHGLKR